MPARDTPQSDHFFLPDLCTVQAVLLLVLVAELLALVLVLADHGLAAFDWRALALTSFYMQWTVLLSAACLCRLRPQLKGWPLAWAAATSYLVILAVAAATAVAGQWLLQGALAGGGRWRIDGWQLLTTVSICAVLAGIALRYFYLTAQLQQRRQSELQARVEALQSRIRPHFLFNSMNSIASLIAVDPQAAERAVEDLSVLFRASLAEAGTEVPWSEERSLCEHYLDIEALRLGSRLRVDWDVGQLPPDLPIPALSLQPLLENAVYHGIQPLPKGGLVRIEGEYHNGRVTITVSNPVAPGEAASHRGNRIAQENIRHRLQAIYGPDAALEAARLGDEYRVVVTYFAQPRSALRAEAK